MGPYRHVKTKYDKIEITVRIAGIAVDRGEYLSVEDL